MRFAREGRPFVAIGFLVLLALGAVAVGSNNPVGYMALALWALVAVWIPIFFRDPHRDGQRGDELIIAPADGVVVSVADTEEDEYLHGPAKRVSIFMNAFNVHVNRHPMTGVVEHRRYQPGRFFNASLDKASIHNERMSLGVRGKYGPILVRQIAGLIARRIVADPLLNSTVHQGERLGIIKFGSRVDVFIPHNGEPTVDVGTKTRAGVTVIGRWK